MSRNLIWVILMSGVLFLLLALLGVGTLLLMPTALLPENTAEAVAVVNVATKPVAVLPTDTPPPVTATPAPTTLHSGGDMLTLPTATSTRAPRPTATSTPTLAPTATAVAAVKPVAPAQLVAGINVGNLARDFTLGSNLANRVSLSNLRGKIVILNFWTTWCPYSTREIPDLQAIHNEYGPQGVVVLTINEGEKLEHVEKFAWDNGVSFNVWLDEDKWAGEVMGVDSYPTTLFIDRDGIIRARYSGALTRDEFLTELKKLM